ncbi:craniofacial development protein 2-like [Ostrea edulis]|uniref:craniofacial development protein 2-like n=1 Tax=Ostrea edulis TaxID=37623 RepID=UPI0024AF8EB3|nr:craniofacial development protein 2-like [Ostrea edulis]
MSRELSSGLTTLTCKKIIVTETATRNLSITVEENLPSANIGTSMTDGSESHEEATNTTKEALNTAKTKTRIGFWNVRTMYAAGKVAQITAEMQRYKLHILGISESRWTEFDKIRTTTGETVLYSGREDGKHHEGVAFILKKGIEKTLMEWKPVNSRLIIARFKGKLINMTLFQCYAPTNDSSEESKDAFYEQIQNELDRTPQHDIKIIMGDMNAKVGSSNMHYDRAMGKHGCGYMNENGERLAEFCTTNNYVIGGTLFPHRDIHKLTWYSPNHRVKNQIDHSMINGTWRRSLLDVRVKIGADIESDHHLVTALIKLKLRGTKQVQKTVRRFDIDRLKDTRVKNEFSIQVKNRFQALQNLPKLDKRDSID